MPSRNRPAPASPWRRTLGRGGHSWPTAVRDAFAVGLGDALTAGAAIAILTAVFTLWRAPRRARSLVPGDSDAAGDARGASARLIRPAADAA